VSGGTSQGANQPSTWGMRAKGQISQGVKQQRGEKPHTF